MRKYIYIIILILITVKITAQKRSIIFYNENTTKSVRLNKGNLVLIEYQGYLSQIEQKLNYLLSVNDSTLILGKPMLFSPPKQIYSIKIKDINGAKRISNGTQLLKFTLIAGSTIGTYYIIRNNKNNLSYFQELGISALVGFSTRIVINKLFPNNKVKHKFNDKWKYVTY